MTVYGDKLVAHARECQQILDTVSPQTAAFIRQRYRLDLYPLEFVSETAAALEQFRRQAIGEAQPADNTPPDEQPGEINALKAKLQAADQVRLEALALVEQWRRRTVALRGCNIQSADAMSTCANDLASLLTRPPT